MNEQNNLGQNPGQNNAYPMPEQQNTLNNQVVNNGVVESQVGQIPEQQPQVVGQPVEQTLQQPIQQSMQQTVQQPVQQPVQQAVQQPVQQPIQQPILQEQQMPQTQQVNGQVVNQDIVAQAPINPIQNNAAPSNGVYGPSIPLNTVNDATNVGFVASAEPLKKKKNGGIKVIIILIILAILGALGYFVVYPYVVKTYFSDPKNVYETSINAAFKSINSTINDLVHQKAIYNIEASFDSNISELKPYTGYSYGINMGVDPVAKTFQSGLIIKNNTSSTEHSYYEYLKDNKKYAKYSSYRGYIYLGEANLEEQSQLFSSFEDIFNTSEKLNSEEIEYLTTKLSTLLINSIDESKLSKEDAILKLNNEELKVTNNKYTVTYDVYVKTLETIVNGLKDDEKALEIIAKITDSELDDVKTSFDEFKVDEENVSEETKEKELYINIYSYGLKNDIVGFEVTSNKDESRLFYYFNSNSFELGSYVYSNDIETGKETENVLLVSGVKKGSSTNVKIKLNDDEVGTLDIKQWNDKGFDIDYTIIIGGDEVKGNIKLTKDLNEERAKYTFDLRVNKGDEFISLNFKFDEDWTSEVANINTNNADTLTDAELAQKQQEFTNALMETPIGALFTTVSNDYNESIYNYYDNNTVDNTVNNNVNAIQPNM